MDIFDQKGLHPMLISEMREPFDDPDYLFELKLDGERCVAYLDGSGTVLQNKRALNLNARYPELTEIHKGVNVKCILDGELAVLVDGKPDFSQVQRRSLLTNPFKIQLAMQAYPACFTAFDILYYQDHPVMDCPLEERKDLLEKSVSENGALAVSRTIEESGIALYKLAAGQDLEGIVAKRKGSLYHPGKRTKDWIKIKNLQDDDFVVCGYVDKGNGVSVVLGQYDGDQLTYKGHVTLGILRDDFLIMTQIPRTEPIFQDREGDTTWLKPELVCAVRYMEKTTSGMLRQPVFKGLRDDKTPSDCQV